MTYAITSRLTSSEALSPEDLHEFFRRRRWYEADGAGFRYADIDTGVAFEVSIETDHNGAAQAAVFELEAPRPMTYGHEVEQELEAFVEAFEVALEIDATEDASSSTRPGEVIEDWEQTNRRVLREQLEEGETIEYMLEGDQLREAWKWNRLRQDYHRQLGGTVFVPRVLFFERDGRLQRGVIWPDAIPMALPEVDMLLVSIADQPAGGDGEPDSYVVDYADFLGALEETVEQVDDPAEHLLLQWEEAPTRLVDELVEEAESADPDSLEGLPTGRIFERELIEQVREQ